MKPINRLEARQGDITRLAVDAIVNAANTQLLAECRTVGGCPTGEARLTRGYGLPAKYVIHTVGPIYRGRPEDPRLLASCYTNSLTLAVDHGIRTLAFPAISCGVYGYPVVDACKIAVDTCAAFMGNHDRPEKVIFMLFSTSNLEIYKRYLNSVAGHQR